jgi:mono/diheme cytochrome c family protein
MRATLQLTAVTIVSLAIPANGAHVTMAPAETLVAPAQAPGAADVAEGMRLYLQKGDCQACHGWAADGRKMDSQMPDGSNLRETRLDRARLIVTI